MADWVDAGSAADIVVGGSRLFRHLDKRIAIFRTSRGVYAVDNRCPHEGYGLAQGDVKGELLTCAWHNWKFQLPTGECVLGGEAVRSYPVEVRNGSVWIDITDPAPEVVAPQLFSSLLEAIGDVDIGRMARDAERLQRIGTPLTEIVREGMRYGAPKVEYGWNHSLATLTDCLNLAELFEGPLRSLPVLQGLSVVSETEVRRPERPRPEPIDPEAVYGSIDAALLAYPRLVDDEDAVAAEALMRGLIASGVEPRAIRHALLSAVTDHFLGYGHPLIYCQKAFEMLDQIGWGEADTVLGPLVPNMTLSTRYDNLPYMRKFLRAWEGSGVDMSDLMSRRTAGPFDRDAYMRTLLDGSPEDAFGSLASALQTGTPVVQLIDATSRAAAERFARFDIDLDVDDTNDWGWLDVTHTLTYTDALRWAWSVDPTPELLRGLFHAAWFVQWTQRFDAKDHTSQRVRPRATSEADDVLGAIRSRDVDATVAMVQGYEGDPAALHGALGQAAAEDNSVAPIMVAHTVKTARAAIVESEALGGLQSGRQPIAAAARFLASPKRERFVYKATLEAIDFVQGRGKGDSEV